MDTSAICANDSFLVLIEKYVVLAKPFIACKGSLFDGMLATDVQEL